MKPIQPPNPGLEHSVAGHDALPIVVDGIDNGRPGVIRSTWILSDDELAALQKTRRVELLVHGNEHPAVSVIVLTDPDASETRVCIYDRSFR